MITFYRTRDCRGCAAVQEALEELCVAHEVVLVGKGAPPSPPMPDGTRPPFDKLGAAGTRQRPPVLVDGDEVFQGHDAIVEHLGELEAFTELWYKFQSDACYCDEEGEAE